MNTNLTQELIEKVVESYNDTQSFKKTAAELKISTVKVRKALLTAGAWTNDTAEEIEKIREEYSTWTDQQIADHLHVSINTVQMYTPYKMGPYDPENRGESATRTAKYRERNRSRAGTVDGNRKEVAALIATSQSDPFDLSLDDTSWVEMEKKMFEEDGLPFSKFRYNPNGIPHVDDQFFLDYRHVEPAYESGRHHFLKAMKLRLEVETDSMSTEQLVELESKYGVKKGWYRDIIVPSYIPLHYLHYVIQNAFGFDNSQPHLFQMSEEEFSEITENSLREYCRLCGLIFRFPFGNDEEIHWDDDYDGKKSIRTWLKEKYTGCWDMGGGTGYTYTDNQYRIWQWLKGPDFHELEGVFDAEDEEAFLKEKGATEYCEIDKDWEEGQFPYNNILESIKLDRIIALRPEDCFWESLKEFAEEDLLDNLFTLEKARKEMDAASEIYKTLDQRMKSGVWDEDTLLVKRWRETAKRAAQLYLLCTGGVSVIPCFSSLVYVYGSKQTSVQSSEQTLEQSSEQIREQSSELDLGSCDQGSRDQVGSDDGSLTKENLDPWKIRITILEEYHDSSIYYHRNYHPADATGAPFQNDPEHEAEWADRLNAMCYWKDKLEVTDSEGRWVVPKDEKDMLIELRPEQELLPEEKDRIEERRAEFHEFLETYESHKVSDEQVVDDKLYKALRRVLLDEVPVCIAKEGAEINGRNLKPENVI